MTDFWILLDLVEKVPSIARTSIKYKTNHKVLESTTNDLGPLVTRRDEVEGECHLGVRERLDLIFLIKDNLHSTT